MDNLFDKKKTYECYNGDEIVNMCVPVIDQSKISNGSVFRLRADMNGRIDVAVFSRDNTVYDGIDTYMYKNHIFNPFAECDEDIRMSAHHDSSLYNKYQEPTLPGGGKWSQIKKNLTT